MLAKETLRQAHSKKGKADQRESMSEDCHLELITRKGRKTLTQKNFEGELLVRRARMGHFCVKSVAQVVGRRTRDQKVCPSPNSTRDNKSEASAQS